MPTTPEKKRKDAQKFIADAMLGSLARKLRIFGFDTVYFKEGRDITLQNIAKSDRRIILTSDEALCASSQRDGLPAILVRGRTDQQRLSAVVQQAGPDFVLRMRDPSLSRCAVCNGELEKIDKADAAEMGVPPKVLTRHRLFYRCSSCSRMYWRGRHWQRLWRLARSLKTKALT